MKAWIVLMCTGLVTLLTPGHNCGIAGYGSSSGGSPTGGAYGGGSGGNGGGYSGISAPEALKSFYNNLNGYNFNFGYNVQDPKYNNYQSRRESGNADPKGQVTGSYSVLDPDGTTRTVNYVADWINGFRATVHDKNGVTQHGYNGYGDNGGASGGGSSSGGGNAAHGSARKY